MPIAPNQIPSALSTIGQLMQSFTTLSNLLNEAQVLINENWVITLAPGITLTITPDQQTALVGQYDSLKAQIAQQYGNLP